MGFPSFYPGCRGRAIASLGVAAAGAIALAIPGAAAAPGELDPGFADRGVFLRPPSGGVASAVDVQPGAYVLAGGWFRGGFVDRLTLGGSPDPGFHPLSGKVAVFDVATQPDGKVVAVGLQMQNLFDVQTRPYVSRKVLRLLATGEVDATFNPPAAVLQQNYYGTGNHSVIVDDGGRIVVAGVSSGTLVVERYLPDGSLDAAFATGGKYLGDGLGGPRPVVVAVPDGYRVLTHTHTGQHCRVLALAADGQVDAAYGDQGLAGPGDLDGAARVCSDAAALADGRVVVVGRADTQGFALRLTVGGRVDTGFDASSLAGTMRQADRVAVDSDGAAIVAGVSAGGESGVRVVRLRPNGAIDPLFGDAGSAWVDLTAATARDVAWLPGASILLVGGAIQADRATGAFAARLHDGDGVRGPGAVGFKWSRVDVAEAAGVAQLTVRRTGGTAGAASVYYRTTALSSPPWTDVTTPATSGQDHDAVSGRLTWADGDDGERVVRVPIGADHAQVEDFEAFEVELYDATGALAGTHVATVAIEADGSPAGFLVLEAGGFAVGESAGTINVGVRRQYYGAGTVSVKVVPKSGTAHGSSDFTATPVTVTWADGETGTKYAAIPILNDAVQESLETFTVELAEATGGAVIGPASGPTLEIIDDDTSSSPPPPPPPPPPPATGSGGGGGGGGGSDGLLFVLLGLACVARIASRGPPS